MISSLDITQLENVRSYSDRITARCPACEAAGNDRKGTHLFINTETGQYGCAAQPGDSEHRREIFALVGITSDCDPMAERVWRQARVKASAAEAKRNRITTVLRAKRAEILGAHAWTEAEVKASSPEQRVRRLRDPRHFLSALFPAEAVVWTGETHHSGQSGKYAAHWRTVERWQDHPMNRVGPMVSPATWMTGEASRSAANVVTSPFVVLDYDGFDGKAPGTPQELCEHIAASLAIVRWLHESLGWELAAILFTGSKSIHAWFHTPPEAVLESLKHTAPALGVDAGLIGRPEHPCRLLVGFIQRPGGCHAFYGSNAPIDSKQRHRCIDPVDLQSLQIFVSGCSGSNHAGR